MYINRNSVSKQTRLKGLFISFRNNISVAYLIVQGLLLRLPRQMRPIENPYVFIVLPGHFGSNNENKFY